MNKHTYYFSHDFTASQDQKTQILIMELGYEGYGLYWRLLEQLAQSDKYQLSTNSKLLKFSFCFNGDASILDKIINNYDLFIVEGDFFYSESLGHRLSKLDDTKRKRAEAGKKGGESKAKNSSIAKAGLKQNPSKAKAILKQTPSKGLANSSKGLANSSRGEERREEDIREEERVKEKSTLPQIQNRSFDGDNDFQNEFDMFEGFVQMSSRLQIAKFREKDFWEHWEAENWKDVNGKRISLKSKINYAYQDFQKTGKSAYFGEGPKQDYQSRLKSNREELQRDFENGGPFKDEVPITPRLRIQA